METRLSADVLRPWIEYVVCIEYVVGLVCYREAKAALLEEALDGLQHVGHHTAAPVEDQPPACGHTICRNHADADARALCIYLSCISIFYVYLSVCLSPSSPEIVGYR